MKTPVAKKNKKNCQNSRIKKLLHSSVVAEEKPKLHSSRNLLIKGKGHQTALEVRRLTFSDCGYSIGDKARSIDFNEHSTLTSTKLLNITKCKKQIGVHDTSCDSINESSGSPRKLQMSKFGISVVKNTQKHSKPLVNKIRK